MDKFEQDMKESRLNTYYMKQFDHMKSIKNKEKKHKEEMEKK
jgi:hypothetical protein